MAVSNRAGAAACVRVRFPAPSRLSAEPSGAFGAATALGRMRGVTSVVAAYDLRPRPDEPDDRLPWSMPSLGRLSS